MENGSSWKVRVQKLGTTLSNMVMPNIGAFIAWGVLTALFIETGWLPNAHFAEAVGPMLTYALPLLIGYTGGHAVYGQRGAVVGAIATFGAISGSSVPMFIGAMVMGPLGAWCIKKFDDAFQSKIRAGFEMLVNNFSAGLIGFALLLIANKLVGPVVATLTEAIGHGVQFLVDLHLLPLANILIEPAKVLFLNNALNHGIFTPLGTEQVLNTGKSVLFLLEANPGPGLGILLAFAVFGKGSAKSSSWGAMIIHFFGGIHEIYFPYVMMKPALFLAAIAGGIAGTFTNVVLGSGLSGPASPGSIIAIELMAPKGAWPHVNVFLGVLVAAVVSFLVAAVILKADKSEGDDLQKAQAATKAAKAASKGQALPVSAEISADAVKQIIFACDAGMGSSAMGASLLRKKVQEAGLDIPVTNKAISTLEDTDLTLIVTQEELTPRAQQRTPRAIHVSVDNFLTSPKYDEIVAKLADKVPVEKKSEAVGGATAEVSLVGVEKVVFAYDKAQGSATMGSETLKAIFKNKNVAIPVETVTYIDLAQLNNSSVLVVVTTDKEADVKAIAPATRILAVDSLVTTPDYDKLVATL
ncbi:PTS mannitol transporter subunit IICBA [Streptococcus gallolyticus]|nr:PTS mannitol transporter subunit IICBA [Streptococcus gallolyticus]MBY5041581.1 PTS mannitol transporter subunit IICBA [Streptococcus gallolyticus]